MAITIKQVNPTRTRVFMGTITENADVHASLIEVAEKHELQTATFELLGGLREVEFRAFDFESQQRKAPLHCQRALEIVAGHGTIFMLEGKPHLHLHLAVAYQDTKAPNGIVVLAGARREALRQLSGSPLPPSSQHALDVREARRDLDRRVAVRSPTLVERHHGFTSAGFFARFRRERSASAFFRFSRSSIFSLAKGRHALINPLKV